MRKQSHSSINSKESQDSNLIFYVRALTGLTGNQKSILYSIASRMGKNTSTWPSLELLSIDSGVPIRTIRRNIRILEKKKIIKVTKGARYASNTYEFLDRPPWPVCENQTGQNCTQTGQNGSLDRPPWPPNIKEDKEYKKEAAPIKSKGMHDDLLEEEMLKQKKLSSGEGTK